MHGNRKIWVAYPGIKVIGLLEDKLQIMLAEVV